MTTSYNNDNNLYDDNHINIHYETFNKDFDDIAFEPETIDDSDEEAAELYGI